MDDGPIEEVSVTFNPQLFLQRRGWVFEMMRREGVTDVLDIGCGEGETIGCLCNPAPWRAPLVIPHAEPGTLYPTLHIRSIQGLDVSAHELKCAAQETAPPKDGGYGHVRWEPLDVKLWHGGLESFNPDFVGVECIVSTEVIEHLPEDILPDFAPMLLGVYHPRLLLITTPSYTFNARFTAPDAPPSARSGFRDPTGRTNRIFRHSDHKFEWTVEEFTTWCRGVADEWGYDVVISGVGRAQEKDEWGRDDELGWASQVAAFRRRDSDEWVNARALKSTPVRQKAEGKAPHQLFATHHHHEHPASGKPSILADEVREVIKERMQKYQAPTMTIHELWFESDLSQLCGGSLQLVLTSLADDDELILRRDDQHVLYWVVEYPDMVIEEPEDEQQDEQLLANTTETPTQAEGNSTEAAWSDTRHLSGAEVEAWGSMTVSGDSTWGTSWGNAVEDGWGSKDWRDVVVATTETCA